MAPQVAHRDRGFIQTVRGRVSRWVPVPVRRQAAVQVRICPAPGRARLRPSRARLLLPDRTQRQARPVEEASPSRAIRHACRVPGPTAQPTAARVRCRTSSRPAMVVLLRRSRRPGLCRRADKRATDPVQGGRTDAPARRKLAPASHRPPARDSHRRAQAARVKFQDRPRLRAGPEVAAPAERVRISIRRHSMEALPATTPVHPRRRAIWRRSPIPDRPSGQQAARKFPAR
jgi:hypothetical protein